MNVGPTCTTTAALALLASLLALAGAPALAQGPVVGFLMPDARGYQVEFLRGGRSHASAGTYGTRVLAPAGFRFGLGDQKHFFYDRAALTEQDAYRTLRQFHVMVMGTPWDGLGGLRDHPWTLTNAQAAGRALERYVREGGGLLILARATGYPGSEIQEYASEMYKPLGVEFLREGVWDPERAFSASVFRGVPPEDFFYTENLTAGHPVTQGVERLALPRQCYGPGVLGLRLSPEWEVLARGEASAQSHPASKLARYDVDYATVGTYAAAPPIAAVRTLGRGRVMVYSLPPIHAYLNYGTPGWSMIVEETGWAERGLPSHSNRLLVNGLRWLAEPATANPELGGFPFAEFAYQPVVYPESVEWDSSAFGAPVAAGVKGVIGARTALSGGTGTVADYAREAQAIGLSFVVFTEALEELTPAEFDQLKAECLAATTDTFYAVPGLEFSDHLDNRWALWCDRLTYPPPTIKVNQREWPIPQWDGRRIHQLGGFLGQSERPPSLLLTYRHLREQGGHPHNMWWFFRLAPWVHDAEGRPVEDNREEYFYALRDLKRVEPVSYTRMNAPQDVARAAQTMVTVARDMGSLHAWMNTRNGSHNTPLAAPYIADHGGQVRLAQWEAINYQLPYHYRDVRGVQRARLRFEVHSPAGIREVRVRDASLGVIRRFLGGGQTELAREFEMVHNRDYYLVLEVEDTQGAVALSSAINLWCYKTSVYRCADNHNLLNGRALVWHSCWDQMLDLVSGQSNAHWRGEPVAGYDTANPWRLDSTFTFGHSIEMESLVRTEELGAYPSRFAQNGLQRRVMDVRLPGRDPIVIEMDIGDLVERYGTDERPSPVYAGLPTKVGENELFRRVHRAYYFHERSNMFTVWDHRRPEEGTAAVRGGLTWHEGEITFKRDATLAGDIPIELVGVQGVGGEAATHVLAREPEGHQAIPLQGGTYRQRRALAAGGYLTVVPNNAFTVVYAPAPSDLHYVLLPDPQGRVSGIRVGIGEAGQKVQAGQKLSYRFAVVTLGSATEDFKTIPEYFAWLDEVGASLGLGGGGVAAAVTVGREVDRELFLTLEAAKGEVLLEAEPREVIVASPFRVRGLQDNGTAAVWSTARPWFRFVGMLEGAALFQADLDAGGTVWAGNVLLSDNQDLTLTVVTEGLGEGRTPFVEIHNPTDRPIAARVWSPEHTPGLGGLTFTVQVPAGDSVRHEL